MRTDRWLMIAIVVVLAASAVVFAMKSRTPALRGRPDVDSSIGSLSLLVIGVKGLDTSIVERLSEEGRLPNITRLIEEGTLAEFETLDRGLDPKIVWTSLATGVSPENQGIGGTRVSPRGEVVPAPLVPKSRTVGTLWTALSEAGMPVGVVGWPGTWPVEEVEGAMVADYTVYYLERSHGGAPKRLVYPTELLDTVDPLVVPPGVYNRKDLAHFVNADEGLGLEALIGKGYEDLATAYAADTSMRDVAFALTAELPLEAEMVTLPGVEIVSQRFWLMANPDQIDWENLTEIVDEQVRGQIPALGDVIDRFYVALDEAVGELLTLAAEDATVAVVSDHGYDRLTYGEQGQPRTGAHMYDETGFWIMTGPRVAQGVRVEGRSLLDFAPTLAAAAGIELGDQVEGRVCREALAAQ
ncbi:MAG: hypothetical protein GF400_08625 [Candidatus Eisenbacteria bacterium]|nr:hypothetical protein [Candidatus Eisenbacteria bacterium]